MFASAILGGAMPHLVMLVDETSLARLPKFEANLRTTLSSGDWGLQPIGERDAVQISTVDGITPTAEQLVVVAVMSRVTTAPSILKLPKTRARVLPLQDFVTIIDSIEDIAELERYWAFIDAQPALLSPFSGPADLFAAFRDSNALLTDGAITPTFLSLDPHWGSTWRHRILAQYWENAPPSLPDNAAWSVKAYPGGLYRLVAKCRPALSWATVLGDCVTHFVLVADSQPIEPVDGRLLETMVQCLADSLNQRRDVISTFPLFGHRRIVTTCRATMDFSTGQHDSNGSEPPLFSEWEIAGDRSTSNLDVIVSVNLRQVQARLADPTDASFEAEAAAVWIEGLSSQLGLSCSPTTLDALRATSARTPRFAVRLTPRVIDAPDYSDPHTPRPEHYKVARRDLAIVFQKLGAEEGKYELTTAKALIDPARDALRSLIHAKIASLPRHTAIRFCIEQLDALALKYTREHARLQLSLTHEVSYDRTALLAEAHREFVRDSRNYRYLLECRLSLPGPGTGEISVEGMLQTAASVDWLMVLYNASDVIHNGLDVAGLELDSLFVPHVYYAESTQRSEVVFANEAADFRLGLGLEANHEVRAVGPGAREWSRLDEAFRQDTGVRLDAFLATLKVLFRWPSVTERKDLAFSYLASRDIVRDTLAASVRDMIPDNADRVISLLSLDPSGIRRLLGKSEDEDDVPVWEHAKRGDRYTIKPLIHDDQGNLTWGAASAERAATIWRNSLGNGYMPADFDWPSVKTAVRDIKAKLERELETATAVILRRATPYTEGGIDLMRRFPAEGFDDVGDYDALCYWPGLNQWLVAECKYNQPTFCLKDARRLRERMFGRSSDRGQFGKIERRRRYLQVNLERVREALGWPSSTAGVPPMLHEIYVSREIYWWMRNAPYSLPTHFLRIDGVSSWLRGRALLS